MVEFILFSCFIITWDWDAHDGITLICARQLGLSDSRAGNMSIASHMPDVYDHRGIFHSTQLWRHSWIQIGNGARIWGSADACCNDNIRGSNINRNSYKGKSAFYYYNIQSRDSGDWYLGYASHYMEDCGQPWHTSANLIQQLTTHDAYEAWVDSNWTSGWNFSASVANDWYYYPVTDPAAAVRSLAKWSHSKNKIIYNAYLASSKPTVVGKGDSTLVDNTRILLRDTGRYVKGLMKFTLDSENAW